MKKQIHILEGIMILIVVFIAFLLACKFIYYINHEEIDTTYMWNIGFDNLNLIDGSKGEVTFTDEAINVNVILKEYNEFADFYIDIVNKGTIDAVLDEYEINVNNPANILTYSVTYADGREITKGDILESMNNEVIHVVITYPPQENKIYDSLELNLSFGMHYVAKK